MKLRNFVGRLLVACILLMPSFAFADTRSDIYNGATCLPYPAGANSLVQLLVVRPRSRWLAHFTMPDGWTVDELA